MDAASQKTRCRHTDYSGGGPRSNLKPCRSGVPAPPSSPLPSTSNAQATMKHLRRNTLQIVLPNRKLLGFVYTYRCSSLDTDTTRLSYTLLWRTTANSTSTRSDLGYRSPPPPARVCIEVRHTVPQAPSPFHSMML